ncbi:MAG: AbrB/MazE/SpoVT family DNA-binding protein [Pseudonocardiales bacterium]|nr:AbrB/MazE/SpoVT family DNA-binding protein [Pseudonocardiales bacterium]
MGDRGRLVIPADIRERLALSAGTPLLILETTHGLVLSTRAQARDMLQSQLAGPDLVEELLRERRSLAAAEDAA